MNDLIFNQDGSPLLRDGVQVQRATLHFEALTETLDRFGHKSKEIKEQSPRLVIDLLGVTIDLVNRSFYMQQLKRTRYAERVEAVLQLDRLGRKDYLRLVGRLQFAAQCFPVGRQWLHAALRVGRANFRLTDDAVPVTPAVKADLRRWLLELRRRDHPGVPLAACTGLSPLGSPSTGAVYADASGEVGWAAWTVAGDEVLVTGGVWSDAVREGLIIAEKELYASTAGLSSLAGVAGLRECYSFTDNTVALAAMRSLTPSTPRMQELTMARLSWMQENGVREEAERVSSKNNLWADLGSQANQAAIELANAPAIAKMREAFVLASSKDGRANSTSATVKYWLYFTLLGRRISPVRSVDAASSRAEKLDEEQLLMDFGIWLMLTKPGGRNISWKTAQKHVSTLQSWHRKQPGSGGSIGADLVMHRLAAMWDGMKRDGPEATRRLRRGVRPQLLAKAMKKLLSSDESEDTMWQAALSTAFCALLRGGEVGTQSSESFDTTLHLCRSDVTFFRRKGVLHVRIQMRPLKKERMRKHKGVTIVLAEGGSILDPVKALWRMLELDPVDDDEEATTPLFRHTRGKRVGEAVSTDEVCDIVKQLMASVGLDPKEYGAHSLRIGGATAALAAGLDAAVIKVLGRWDSDVYEIYARCTREAAAMASTLIGSTPFHDTEGPIVTEEFDELAAPGLPSLQEIAVAVMGDGDDEDVEADDDVGRDE